MEHNKWRQPLLVERAASWLIQSIKENKVPLLASIIAGILAHMFAFTNKLVNYDDIHCLFSKGSTFGLGRWGLSILDNVFPNYSMPWIYGIISILLMAISACIIIHIYHIHSKLLQVLLAGSILSFPSLTATVTFMFTLSSYAVSFMLAVLAVWFLQKDLKRYGPFALICMVASLSLYQAYIAVAASLFVLILIQQLLLEESITSVIRKGILFLGFLILSLGLYYLATLLINQLRGSTFSGMAENALSFDLASIPSDIITAYRTYFSYLNEGVQGLIPTTLSRILHYLCFIAAAALLVMWGICQRKKHLGRFLLLAALLAIFPLASNCMYLFVDSSAVHTLVLYGIVSIYVLFAVIAEVSISLEISRKAILLCQRAALNVIIFGFSILIVINTYVANEAYLNLYLRYENSYAFYTSLIADLKVMPGFDENTKLAVIGWYHWPDYFIEPSSKIMGASGFMPDEYPKENFLRYFLGFPISMATAEEIDQITSSVEFAEMPVYPYYGSMKMIGNICVVKLSPV